MTYTLLRADKRHRDDINRLIRKAKIGSPMSGRVPRMMWVVRMDGKIVAFAQLAVWSGKVGILEGVVVEKKLRHRGIGSMLINHRLCVARKRGIKIFALVTMYYHYNFYKRRGFRTCPRAKLPEVIKNFPQFTNKRYMKCAVMIRGI